MRQSTSHKIKSRAEREYYAKALKNLDYEPTVDDTLDFPETDDKDRDYSIPTSPHRRKKTSMKQKLIEHFEDNWIKWVFAGVGTIIFFFMIDSKVDITRIDTKVEIMSEDVIDLKKSDKENLERFHKHELELQKANLKIESLENKE